ncbi:MAG: ATP-dependent 6-phosphofructokinase, partial [Desulfobulbaceae bacterium]|nr:ATP-dependent 6-phosphofructokinase [Desulfobulbaceae bacterium]
MKKIVISTGGGDAPGLNAVIYAVVKSASSRGWEVFGSRVGYKGLLDLEELVRLDPEKVEGITSTGGTILGSTNKGNPFAMPVENLAGEIQIRDVSDRVVKNFTRMGFHCHIAVGGDGSLEIAHRFATEKNMPVIGVPKTIDNDLEATQLTFGFDTAVSTATNAIDRLHSTAKSHDRVMVVEVMGREAGWIALNSGISGDADIILLPEIPFNMEKVCEKIADNELHDKDYAIVVVAEGAKAVNADVIYKEGEVGRQEVLLGGIGEWVAEQIRKQTGKDTRSLVLGHLQRGGSPTTFDRLLALRFGAAAVRLAEEEKFDHMPALTGNGMAAVTLEEATRSKKLVPLDCDKVWTARDIG